MTDNSTSVATRANPAEVTRKPGPRVPNFAISIIIAVLAIAVAESVAAQGWVSELVLPAPSAVWQALVDGFARGVYWRHIASTAGTAVGGFIIASIVAILVAGIMASIQRLEHVLVPFIYAFQCLPKIAVAPLVILAVGFGQESKVVIVVISTFFPIFVNTLQGLRVRDRTQYELFQSLGASKFQQFRLLKLPASLPYVFAGLHIGVILSLIGAIVAEFVGSPLGLGYYMTQQRSQFNVPAVYAVLLVLMVLGMLFHGAVTLLEKRLAFWAGDVGNVSI